MPVKILLVEDEPDTRQSFLLVASLLRLNFEVVGMTHEEATFASLNDYDGYLVDDGGPFSSKGVSFMHRARVQGRNDRVILICGHPTAENVERARQLDPRLVTQKPYDAEHLLKLFNPQVQVALQHLL